VVWAGHADFSDLPERLRELSAQRDPLEKPAATVEFEIFRVISPQPSGGGTGQRVAASAFDPVLTVLVPVLQALHGRSPAQAEDLVAGRQSWTRFCGLGASDAVPEPIREAWPMAPSTCHAHAARRADPARRSARALPDAGLTPLIERVFDERRLRMRKVWRQPLHAGGFPASAGAPIRASLPLHEIWHRW
jgi:hypothetical protein